MVAFLVFLVVVLLLALGAVGWRLNVVRAGLALEPAETAEQLAARVIEQHAAQLDAHIDQLERLRRDDAASLRQMVVDLRDVTDSTRIETARLATSLQDHRVRGLWGETQLRRVIEHAGMERFCDFVEQQGSGGSERRGRPDVVVRLPNGRCTVIDAKAPLDRYLAAANEADPTRRASLVADHARAVRGHVVSLSRRSYAELVDGALDTVVLFLPGDAYLNAALDGDPTLLESAWADDIVLATPSSLFALLRVIGAGWQEQRLAEEAAEVARLGRELHDRIGVFVEHFAKVGAGLARTVEAYNKSVGSLEARLCSTARKLEEHGAGSRRTLPAPSTLHVDAAPRVVSVPAIGDG